MMKTENVIVYKPTDKDDDMNLPSSNVARIFLAGGCSTDWRDEFIAQLRVATKYIFGKDSDCNVVIYSPKCDTTKIKLDNLITWEHDKILLSDILVFNFEGSESVQPGSLYELGRYTICNAIGNHTCIINADKDYKLLRELNIHTKLIDMDLRKSYSDTGLRKLVVNNFSIKQLADEVAEEIKFRFLTTNMVDRIINNFNKRFHPEYNKKCRHGN